MAKILDMRNEYEVELDLDTKEGEEALEEVQDLLFGRQLFDKDDPVLKNITFGLF